MVASTFELFKIGVGPSSSHTMGPMLAAATFAMRVAEQGILGQVTRMETKLFGSLALTGKGHATDRAVLLGLSGRVPENIEPDAADALVDQIRNAKRIHLNGTHDIVFDEDTDVIFDQRKRLDFHSNAMRFTAFNGADELVTRVYYSVGGGAILDEDQIGANDPESGLWDVPHPFCSGADLLRIAEEKGLSIADIMRNNERVGKTDEEISATIREISDAMSACIDRGIKSGGILPGGLRVKRRAPLIHARLMERQERALSDPLTVLDWVNLWALAVNEENAAGGKVVTAPTNGAAGIVPSVLRFYERFSPKADVAGIETFLLTAAAIGSLFKENASISGAEVGCQGEVGVACSMAAAGLTAAWGGTPLQVENAAEIGMEHNLGLTCDPVAGLVQVPCIERNAVGAVKAIEAARLSIMGDGTHRVSLDEVIETMRKTGLDMSERYKETSQGGLAVNLVEC
ncbi:L-serine ammonia-lyase [Parasphingorhabdus cellanae]|uniref:L-serine dehydratase n=1 Tax=Parasphingorhabdus cellanae TaxID=2806553 RepID=A0ABX7T3U0_9SPHN|nr:L-serine ammonia-lyase [Parasphingorhabdus cellanae]QTD54915.1 L-serine ammonia-lyase [Parasphingorhabdus cellanae]